MPQAVYCDEAGFTGENLLNREQRFFAYAAVAVEPIEADELVKRITRDYRVQAEELKGRKLLRYAKGRKAIEEIIKVIGSGTRLVVHHKEYALATKFFEYVFEPLVSTINSVFYEINFHKFVGNILYLNMLARHERARTLAERFETAARGDDAALRGMFSVHGIRDEDPVEQLIQFGVYNRDSVLRELREVRRFGGWMLELTLTSIWSLLTFWGERNESLDVHCDNSLPLRDQKQVLDMMVGRTDKAVVTLGRRRRSYLFNLARPISLVESNVTPGIQLADVMATTAAFAFDNRQDPWCRVLLKELWEVGAMNGDCVLPEIEMVDPKKPQSVINYVVLLELVQRSQRGTSLTRGITDFIEAAYETFPEFERRFMRYDVTIAAELESLRSGG